MVKIRDTASQNTSLIEGRGLVIHVGIHISMEEQDGTSLNVLTTVRIVLAN
jgi:hypothetical protein